MVLLSKLTHCLPLPSYISTQLNSTLTSPSPLKPSYRLSRLRWRPDFFKACEVLQGYPRSHSVFQSRY